MKKQGYIFIVTLLMIAGMTATGTYIYLRSTVFIPFMRTMYDREKAKELALGGLQIGIQQLSYFEKEESENGEKKSTQAGGPQQLFTRIMPLINRWQKFNIRKNTDGIDGTMQVCLVCEEGKININRIYNFDKSQFNGVGQPKGDWQKILGLVCRQAEDILGGKELFSSLESFLKNRKYPLYDVTELLTIKEFSIFRDRVFYQPDGRATLYLTDLFTTFSDKNTIEPRLFSDSMLNVLKLPYTASTDQAKLSEQIKGIETFKQTAQWPSDWETQLKPLYATEFPSVISGLESVLSTQFNPTYFSVFSYGTVGNVTQRLLAIVQRNKRARNGKTGYDSTIKKLYWL